MNEIKFDQNGFAIESGFLETHETDQENVYIGTSKETYVTKGFGLRAGSYLDAPTVTAKKNEAIVRKDNTWVVTPDFRGQIFYKKESGEAITISKIGTVPDDLTDKPRPDEFHEWKGNKWVLNEALKADTLKAQNTQIKSALLFYAKDQIEILQEELDLEMADDEVATEAKIKEWKVYRVTLNKVDVTKESIEWPIKPE